MSSKHYLQAAEDDGIGGLVVPKKRPKNADSKPDIDSGTPSANRSVLGLDVLAMKKRAQRKANLLSFDGDSIEREEESNSQNQKEVKTGEPSFHNGENYTSNSENRHQRAYRRIASAASVDNLTSDELDQRKKEDSSNSTTTHKDNYRDKSHRKYPQVSISKSQAPVERDDDGFFKPKFISKSTRRGYRSTHNTHISDSDDRVSTPLKRELYARYKDGRRPDGGGLFSRHAAQSSSRSSHRYV